VKYAWIHEHRGIFKPAAMFRALGAVPQGYYQWAKRNDNDDESDRVLVAEIRDVMVESRQTYGVKRVTQALKERVFHVNHKRVERLMREHDIRCKKVKRFKKTTNSNHKFPASEDRLQRRFDVAEPNRVWVSDINYVRTREAGSIGAFGLTCFHERSWAGRYRQASLLASPVKPWTAL
jgi:putative transposase